MMVSLCVCVCVYIYKKKPDEAHKPPKRHQIPSSPYKALIQLRCRDQVRLAVLPGGVSPEGLGLRASGLRD